MNKNNIKQETTLTDNIRDMEGFKIDMCEAIPLKEIKNIMSLIKKDISDNYSDLCFDLGGWDMDKLLEIINKRLGEEFKDE